MQNDPQRLPSVVPGADTWKTSNLWLVRLSIQNFPLTIFIRMSVCPCCLPKLLRMATSRHNTQLWTSPTAWPCSTTSSIRTSYQLISAA